VSTEFTGIQSTIHPISDLSALGGAQKTDGGKTGETGGVFADIFQTAIDNVKSTDKEMVEAQYLLATGQLDNPAEATIAATKATAAVELLIQLRNKALDAYGELNRISL
jgi:flagellar hook-basal body complex protein FliE